jgi:hypothetical protein
MYVIVLNARFLYRVYSIRVIAMLKQIFSDFNSDIDCRQNETKIIAYCLVQYIYK